MDDTLHAAIKEVIPELADVFETFGYEATVAQVIEAFEDAGLRIEFMEQGSNFA